MIYSWVGVENLSFWTPFQVNFSINLQKAHSKLSHKLNSWKEKYPDIFPLPFFHSKYRFKPKKFTGRKCKETIYKRTKNLIYCVVIKSSALTSSEFQIAKFFIFIFLRRSVQGRQVEHFLLMLMISLFFFASAERLKFIMEILFLHRKFISTNFVYS